MFAIVKRLQQGTCHCLPFQNGMRSRMIPCFRRCSSVVEQLTRNEKVRGPIPRIGTKFARLVSVAERRPCKADVGGSIPPPGTMPL